MIVVIVVEVVVGNKVTCSKITREEMLEREL